MRLILATVLLWGYLCLLVTSKEDEITNSTETELQVRASDSGSSNCSEHYGPKRKVKNVLNKVKETFKQVGGGGKRFNFRFKNNNQDSYSTRYDTTTVLWIIFGAMGGGFLLMGLYYFIRLHSKN